MMLDRLAVLETRFSQSNANFLELDVHHPTGCFNVDFLNPFTLCYDNVTNIVGESFWAEFEQVWSLLDPTQFLNVGSGTLFELNTRSKTYKSRIRFIYFQIQHTFNFSYFYLFSDNLKFFSPYKFPTEFNTSRLALKLPHGQRTAGTGSNRRWNWMRNFFGFLGSVIYEKRAAEK